MLIGAVVGGVAAGIISYAQTGSVNWNAVGAAALGGATVGGIIATGVGLLAAPAVTTTGLATAGTELVAAAGTANIACGGDMCASEVQDVSKTLQNANQTCGGDLCASEVQDSSQKVVQAANAVENWLGGNISPPVRNKAGDFILRNAENTKKFRFDFYNYAPHPAPHFNLEWLDEAGEWIGSDPIYPK